MVGKSAKTTHGRVLAALGTMPPSVANRLRQLSFVRVFAGRGIMPPIVTDRLRQLSSAKVLATTGVRCCYLPLLIAYIA